MRRRDEEKRSRGEASGDEEKQAETRRSKRRRGAEGNRSDLVGRDGGPACHSAAVHLQTELRLPRVDRNTELTRSPVQPRFDRVVVLVPQVLQLLPEPFRPRQHRLQKTPTLPHESTQQSMER